MTPSDKASPPPRIVRCPNCGGNSLYGPSNAYRPFCGERCKTADLGAWATESYRVPAAPPPEGYEQELSGDPLDTYRAPPPLH